MRRLLIGLGSLVFVLATIVLVAPLFLPKDEIKRQVVAEVDKRLGWRVRLDGPVSLSLLPGFSLVAENVGLSGEAGPTESNLPRRSASSSVSPGAASYPAISG
ncbi:hypothetical protein ACFQEX_01340 [Roseibium salinum]|uniref:hypothetical protein n=1 Tax=Roseibium salinum TaxID=1604349 RepID=UPI003612AE7D